MHSLVYSPSHTPSAILAALLSHPFPHFYDNPCTALVCFPLPSSSRTHLISCSFYCIILLTALFLSSCYWQPIPLASSMSSSWATNATFATVVAAALSSSVAAPLPAVIRLADRCWCDVSSSRLFEPFDIARWERASVEQLKEELERDAASAEQLSSDSGEADSPPPSATNGTRSIVESQLPVSEAPSHTCTTSTPAEPVSQKDGVEQIAAVPPLSDGPPVVSSVGLPLFRRKYDLRPYGFSMILDFGWSREK